MDCFVSLLQVNVIHAASPMEHASHMAAQPQFVHPEHHAFVDLSGHNLASPHPFAGRIVGSRRAIWVRSGMVGMLSHFQPGAQPPVPIATAGWAL